MTLCGNKAQSHVHHMVAISNLVLENNSRQIHLQRMIQSDFIYEVLLIVYQTEGLP